LTKGYYEQKPVEKGRRQTKKKEKISLKTSSKKGLGQRRGTAKPEKRRGTVRSAFIPFIRRGGRKKKLSSEKEVPISLTKGGKDRESCEKNRGRRRFSNQREIAVELTSKK